MRSLDIGDERIASILIADDLASPGDESLDLQVHLQDERRFVLTLHTLAHVQRRLDQALCFPATGLLIVKHFSDEAIREAVRSALSQGLDRFGVLQPPISQ